MNIQSYFQNNKFQKFIFILAIVVVVLGIFELGFQFGYRHGSFSRQWDERTFGQFGKNHSQFTPFDMMGRAPNPHGAFGQIISIQLPKLIVQNGDNDESVIVIDSNTAIRKQREVGSTSDLTIGADIVTFGDPNDSGEIRARLIRIMPADVSTSTSFRPRFNSQR
jgi:hypothetical protein